MDVETVFNPEAWSLRLKNATWFEGCLGHRAAFFMQYLNLLTPKISSISLPFVIHSHLLVHLSTLKRESVP